MNLDDIGNNYLLRRSVLAFAMESVKAQTNINPIWKAATLNVLADFDRENEERERERWMKNAVILSPKKN